jgi:glycosyltransferase involved in cell wall biosynthesis
MTAVQPGLVSTIIPVHNRPDLLRQAVESLLAQTYRPIEIIIVDDGSTDDTPAAIRALVAGEPDLIQAVRIANAGPGPAREAGRLRARGEFIQYLDSDDRLLPEKFELQTATLRAHPDCGIAYGHTRLIDTQGQVLCTPFKWSGRDLPFLFPGLLVDRWWSTHTPLYRRTLTDRIGPWSDLRWSQDWEYDARAGALRTRLVSCHAEVSEHRIHDGVRQTEFADWERDPVRLRNRVRLLSALWDCANQAGVVPPGEETRHFARWAFTIARRCGAVGLVPEAGSCLELAFEAANLDQIASRGMKAYQQFSKLFGVHIASVLFIFIDRLKNTTS